MKRVLTVLFTSAFLAAAIAVAVNAVGPASAQALPGVLRACAEGQKVIVASKLPDVWNTEICPVGERMIVDGAIGSVLPARGKGVYVEGMTPSGVQEMIITRSESGTVEVGKVGREAHGAEPESSGSTALAATDECSDKAFSKLGYRVESRLRYFFNRATTPNKVTRAGAEKAIRRAGNNIANTKNNCGLGDRVPTGLAYAGNTPKVAQISNNGCMRDDGYSVVSFGKLSYVLGLACTSYEYRKGYDKVLSSDIKLNKAEYKWTTNPLNKSCNYQYDVESIMTHEFGHTFGLNHPRGNHPNLTMNSSSASCDASVRILGKGDVLGLDRIYP